MLNLLNTTITIQRQTFGQDNNFGITSSPSNVYTSIPASIQPSSATTQEFYGQRQVVVSNTIYIDQAISQLTLKRGDVAVDASSNTYRVHGWRDLAGRGRVMAIDVELYEP